MNYGPEQSGRLIRGGRALGVGLAAVSSLIYLDGRAGRRQWPPTKTRLVGVPSPDVEELAISYPGIGSLGGPDQARQTERIIPAPSAHFEYSTDRITTRGLVDDIRQEAPAVRRIHVSGHSMGGPLGLETSRRAKGGEAKFGRIVLFCSPFGLHDGKSGAASKVLKAVKWSPGPGHKFVFQAARSILEGKPVRESLQQARADAKTGCSPRVWLSMRDILESIKLQKYRAEYADMVDEQTEAWFCMPEDPDRDPSVFTVQASEQYGEFFEELGVPYTIWRIPDVGHANVSASVDYLVHAMGGSTDTDPLDLAA